MTASRVTRHLDDVEPTARELRAIEAEWPLIAVELAVVDAEIAAAAATTELEHRRARRALAALTRRIVADAAVDGVLGGAA